MQEKHQKPWKSRFRHHSISRRLSPFELILSLDYSSELPLLHKAYNNQNGLYRLEIQASRDTRKPYSSQVLRWFWQRMGKWRKFREKSTEKKVSYFCSLHLRTASECSDCIILHVFEWSLGAPHSCFLLQNTSYRSQKSRKSRLFGMEKKVAQLDEMRFFRPNLHSDSIILNVFEQI